MFEQLSNQLEPLLMSYGIWIALFFAAMIAVPVGLIIWMQKRQNRETQTQLSAYYDTLAERQRQTQGWETLLLQYQAQAQVFQGITLQQSQPVSQQQDTCLELILRLKSDLKNIEAQLSQNPTQAILQLEEGEAESQQLKNQVLSIEAWHKQLNQQQTQTQMQLEKTQTTLSTLPDSPAHANLAKILASVQDMLASNPLQAQLELETCSAELAALQSHVSAESPSQPVTAAAEPEAAITTQTQIQDRPLEPVLSSEPVTETEQALEQVDLEPAEPAQEAPPAEPRPDPKAVAETTLAETPESPLSSPDSEGLSPSVSESPVSLAVVSESEQSPSAADSEPANLKPPATPGSDLPFAEAEDSLNQLQDCLNEINALHDKLSQDFETEAWVSAWPFKDRAQYLAEEAQYLLQLARRLYVLPAAPSHRARLNRERVLAKVQAVQDTRQHLHATLETLQASQHQLQAQVRPLAERLRNLRETGKQDDNWIQTQAALLKQVQQGLEIKPVALHKYQQIIQDVEATLLTQV